MAGTTPNENRMMEVDELIAEYDHIYNFINIPWDDRTKKSKIGIFALLITIFVAIIALVTNSIVLHYTFNINKKDSNTLNCQFAKAEEYTFVAKIFSTSTNKLLCVGAVLDSFTVLANEICTKSGAILLRLGTNMPYCKKGFTVDAIEVVNGFLLEKLVILRSYESFAGCATTIKVGSNLSSNTPANILGRPLHGSRSFSRQPVTLVDKQNCTEKLVNEKGEIQRVLCVQILSKCRVRAGDLLIQNLLLYGFALANTPNRREKSNKIAYFFDIDVIKTDLREFENAM